MFEKDKTNEKNIEQNTGFKKENSTEKGFFKDLAVNFAWSEDDFGIKDDTILKGEEHIYFANLYGYSNFYHHKQYYMR